MLVLLFALAACNNLDNGEDTDHHCGDGTYWDGSECVVDEDSAEPDADTDGDTDSDTDTDADTDTDTDSDTDTDTDADADIVVCASGGDFTELQDAIDAASDGEVIALCAGTYDWAEIERKDLTIYGSDGAEVTTIEGITHAPLSLLEGNLALSEVTLTGTVESSIAFALSCTNSTLSMSRVIVSGAVMGSGNGIGLSLQTCDSEISELLVESNPFTGDLLEAEGGSLVLRHSIFRDNAFGAPGHSDYASWIYASGVDAEISNNLFYRNGSNYYGVSLDPGESAMWMYNNVLYGNNGGSSVRLYEGVDFENNIVSGNDGYYGGGSYGVDGWDASVAYNDAWDNEDDNFNPRVSMTNSIELDPKFSNPDAGDFTLDPGFSPCIDAGNPLSGYNDVDDSRNDMGAFGGPDGDWDPTW